MNKPLQYAEKFVANNCKKAIDVNGELYIPLNEVIRLISERTKTIHYKHKWEFARFVCDNEYRNKLI